MKRRTAEVLIALISVGAASCGSDGRTSQVVEIVVPAGTQDRLDRGEIVDVMPAVLEFRVGDTLRIRNDDRVAQFVGPYRVLAGQRFEFQYGSTGRYGGLCDLSGAASYEIVITE